MKPTITATPQQGFYEGGEEVTLTADLTGALNPTYAWTGEGLESTTGATVKTKLPTKQGGYEYTVTVTPQGGAASEPGTITLNVQAASDAGGGGTEPKEAEPLLVFRKGFAITIGLLLLALLVLLALPLREVLYRLLDKVKDSDKGTNLATVTGGVIGLSLVLIGALVIVGGLFGGLLEVRGRLRTEEDLKIDQAAAEAGLAAKGAVDLKGVAAVVDAVGKLRGAALILVIGCVPLLAAAWIGHAAVDTPSPSETTVVVDTTDPTATDPTATDPTATDPTATDPPATDPPASDPPVTPAATPETATGPGDAALPAPLATKP